MHVGRYTLEARLHISWVGMVAGKLRSSLDSGSRARVADLIKHLNALRDTLQSKAMLSKSRLFHSLTAA
jgi:hypothetical protein